MKEWDEVQYEFEKSLLNIDRVSSKALFDSLIKEVGDSKEAIKIIEKIIVTSLQHIGDGWIEGKVSLAQVYMSSKLCAELISKLIPNTASCIENQPEIAMCCFEDYNLIGKQIVSAVIRANGYKINDYGCSMKLDKLIDNIKRDDIEVIIISTLMLTSAYKVKEVKKELYAINPDIKIIVGGPPFLFDSELWKEIGAYTMSKNTTDIIAILESLTR